MRRHPQPIFLTRAIKDRVNEILYINRKNVSVGKNMVTFIQRNTTKEKADRRIKEGLKKWKEGQQNNKVTDLLTPFSQNNQDILICRYCPNDAKLAEFGKRGPPD